MHAEIEMLWFVIAGFALLNAVWFFGFMFIFAILKLDQIAYDRQTEDYKIEKPRTKPGKSKPLTLVKKP